MLRQHALLTTNDGKPRLLELHVRESETAPARLKVHLCAPLCDGIGIRHPEGDILELHPPGADGSAKVCDDFRLEMN